MRRSAKRVERRSLNKRNGRSILELFLDSEQRSGAMHLRMLWRKWLMMKRREREAVLCLCRGAHGKRGRLPASLQSRMRLLRLLWHYKRGTRKGMRPRRSVLRWNTRDSRKKRRGASELLPNAGKSARQLRSSSWKCFAL